VQQAFIDEGGLQCSHCTPGSSQSGANLLPKMLRPIYGKTVARLQGNLCRCAGYYKLVRAAGKAADE
jgi:aerobic-type carbon monoxide dehydrogenase small subunit (CoxS/CutS family)